MFLLLFFVLLPTGRAAITFTFDYSTAAGFTNLQERISLETAAAIVGNWFDHEVELNFEVETFEGGPFELASGGSVFLVPPNDFPGGYWPGVVMHKVLAGEDQNGAAADGLIRINISTNINWDFDDDISPDAQDFKSTMMHELLHAFGFGSGIREQGGDYFNSLFNGPGIWEPFDQYLISPHDEPLIDGNFILNPFRWNFNKTGGASPTNGLFFSGPATLVANNMQPVGLYTPSTFFPGSSVGHIDDDNPEYEGMLMLAGTADGPGARTLSRIETAMLTDLGYTMLRSTILHVANLRRLNMSLIQIQFEGAFDRSFLLQQSSTLEGDNRWFSISTVNASSGLVEITLPLSGASSTFYRGLIPAP